jgi:hypothetical protein
MAEYFFAPDGKCTGFKFYWNYPKGVADLYPPPERPPPCVTNYFGGLPLAPQIDTFYETFAEDMSTEFVGPYAGPLGGMVYDKKGTREVEVSLTRSHPDITFNPTKVMPSKGPDGGWWCMMLVSGTFTGEPFTPMPGKLPALQANGTKWTIGPTAVTVYPSEDGKRIKRLCFEPQSKGALAGPPGIYVKCGGAMPGSEAENPTPPPTLPSPTQAELDIFCQPCVTDLGEPDKVLGPAGKQAQMWVMEKCGQRMMRIKIDAGFDWLASVKPYLAGQPDCARARISVTLSLARWASK